MAPAIMWFRKDLRVDDNPALAAAHECGEEIIPVYIWSPDQAGDGHPGAASRWWLHHSLVALNAELEQRGSRLLVRQGDPSSVLRELLNETGATAVFFNRRYEPAAASDDERIESELVRQGIGVSSFNGTLLFEPWSIQRKQGGPFQVFTAFWNACKSSDSPAAPKAPPKRAEKHHQWPQSLKMDDLGLLPAIDWAAGMRETWQPGEIGARTLLKRFVKKGVSDYPEERNRPDREGTSRLSPHLAWGEISPRRIWHEVTARVKAFPDSAGAADIFLSQLGWREFGYHLLHHFPRTTSEPLREPFAEFPWAKDTEYLRAWEKGRTGYPIVDAGMRELWHTGWMHNRVRMIVASFLTKDLLIPWQEGAAWFWDTLVDADLANNTLGWQWTAGCGADAAPYFRIFNPVTQGQKFDPEGEYVRRWIPELVRLPGRWIHEPWTAPLDVLSSADVELDRDYPGPIVDHGEARKRALSAYDQIKRRAGKR